MEEEEGGERLYRFAPSGLPHCELDDEVRARLVDALGEEEVRAWLRHDAQRPPRDTVVVVHAEDVEAAAEALRGRLPSVRVRRHERLRHVLILEAREDARADAGPWRVEAGAEVVVDRRCAEAVLRGADVMAPGVLAAPAAMKDGDTVLVTTAMEPVRRTADGADAVPASGIDFPRGTRTGAREDRPGRSQSLCRAWRDRTCLGVGTSRQPTAQIFRGRGSGLAVEMDAGRKAFPWLLPMSEVLRATGRLGMSMHNLPVRTNGRRPLPLFRRSACAWD